MSSKGVTSLELLLSATILLVILGVITQGIQGGSQVVTSVISDTELLEDTRITAQMIADGVARAVYVYPPGATLTLNQGSSWRVKNARTNTNRWLIGTDPIIAYLEAPKRSEGHCSDASESAREACLYFMAYYALPRAVVTQHLSYLQDPQNDNTWVLFEYRRRLDLTHLDADTLIPTGPDSGLIQTTAEMVADYLVPEEGFLLSDTVCRKRLIISEAGDASSQVCADFSENYDPYYLKTLLSGRVKLLASVRRGRQSFQTPTFQFSLAPRNLY